MSKVDIFDDGHFDLDIHERLKARKRRARKKARKSFVVDGHECCFEKMLKKYMVWDGKNRRFAGCVYKGDGFWRCTIEDLKKQAIQRLYGLFQSDEVEMDDSFKTRREAGEALVKAHRVALEFHMKAPILQASCLSRHYWSTRCRNKFYIEAGADKFYLMRSTMYGDDDVVAFGTCRKTIECYMNSNDGFVDVHGNADHGLDKRIIRDSLEVYYAGDLEPFKQEYELALFS